jgi:hypothetical protein
MPAFAYWKGKIQPYTRSSEVVSSLDVFPTFSRLAGIPNLPEDRVYDGRDMADILLTENGTSRHEFLFFYGNCHLNFKNYSQSPTIYSYAVTAVRHGSYKAHFCTGPGLGADVRKMSRWYHPYPLLFNVDQDPGEAYPLSKGYYDVPSGAEDREALERIVKAYAFEVATFEYGSKVPEPDGPDEGPGRYGVCCDRERECNCRDDAVEQAEDNGSGPTVTPTQTDGPSTTATSGATRIGGLFSVGTKGRHELAFREYSRKFTLTDFSVLHSLT